MTLFERLFGYSSKPKKEEGHTKSFALDRDAISDGAILSDSITDATGGISSISYDIAQVPAEEQDLIRTYRTIATSSEIDEALHEIRNEVFVFDVPGERAVELSFSEEEGTPPVSIQKKIIEEFRQIYEIIEFQKKGLEYFDDWYVDSRLVFHKIIDENDLKAGIKKVVQIDPLQIRKIRLVPRQESDGTIDHSKIKEMYVYSNNFGKQSFSLNGTTDVFYGTNINGMMISPDAITYVHSGLFDRNTGRYIGYLKKAILPYNNLRMMEDAMLIFRVVRAPQRRAFYIDVSSMQKNKAEQYMKDMMSRFKNKMVYDASTGSLSDRRNIQSMMEDYWLPRRDGSRGTEIQTLEGQDSASSLEEVEYYRDKLWRALNVPRSRFAEQNSTFVFGKSEEIQRDEYRFRKFLTRLRKSFMFLFEDLLRTQLVLKKVIMDDEWDDIRRYMFWNFTEDNAFVEYKESEIIKNRVEMLGIVDPYVGKYFSKEWVLRKILKMNDDEIEKEESRKEDEPDEEAGSFEGDGFGGDMSAEEPDTESPEGPAGDSTEAEKPRNDL